MSLTVGAVTYDPKVIAIWEGFKAWFLEQGLDFDFVLYSTYERQVEGLFRGEHDVSWNSPLAWVQADRVARRRGRTARALAMRDTDRDLTSLVLVRADGPRTVPELDGRAVATGAADSPQATLIPLSWLADHGAERVRVVRFDRLLGKHGDHVGGERDAARALVAGEVDAACILDGNLAAFAAEGTLPPGSVRVLTVTDPYDHCVFTALDGGDEAALARFEALLMSMRYDDPAVRPLLDLEGLKQWRPGRVRGFAQLERAVDRFGTIDAFVDRLGRA